MSALDELLAANRLIDLTQPLGPGTVLWPGSRPFTADTTVDHDTHGAYARDLALPEHSGTHLDVKLFWYICTIMIWVYLGIAIATEVAGTVALKFTDGFTRAGPSAVVVLGYGLSFVFLALTLRGLSLGLTYAIWAGAGTAAVALIGMAALGEPVSALRLACIALIVAGVVGLNFAGGH